MTKPATPTQAPPFDLASLYAVDDPEHTYTIPDNLLKKPVAAAATPEPQPAKPTAEPSPGNAPAPAPSASVPQPAAAATVPPQQPALEPASAPAPAKPATRHPAWLLGMAEKLGIHPLVVDRLDSDALGDVVSAQMHALRAENAADTRAHALTTQPANAPQAPASNQPAPSLPNAPPDQRPPEAGFLWGEFEERDVHGRVIGKKKYEEADIDPAVAHHIKSQDARIKALEETIAGMHNRAAANQESALQKRFDVVFDTMPQVFGKGTATSLKGTQEWHRRSSVYLAVKGMFMSLPEEVRPTLDLEKAIVGVAKTMFGAEPVAAAATQPEPPPPGHKPPPTPEQYANGHAAVPTGRKPNGKPLGREAAAEAVAAQFQEWRDSGGLPSGGETSLDEFLP